MRMRKKKHSDERLSACAYLLCEKSDSKLGTRVGDEQGEIHLEIGCGKGAFACGMSANYPNVTFYAMERIPNVMINALERAEAESTNRLTDNLRFIIADAETLADWFDEASIDVIYLNFSDPWPKERHAKRRLTHRNNLERYFKFLKDGGKIRFKTDNVKLFDFTLDEIAALGLQTDFITRDLHHSPYNEGNVMTEYEKNFSSQGYPIHMLSLTKPTEK